MPRRQLRNGGGVVFHLLNRAVRRNQIFFNDADYRVFERVLAEAVTRTGIRLLAYCVMPNHWHLVVWPESDEIPRFMHWLTATHTRRWHMAKDSRGTGHVYQDRYHAVPVQTEVHLLTVLRYVERNALRAGLVARAEDWRWSSLWRRCNSCNDLPLATWPILQPHNWPAIVNAPQAHEELALIQNAIRKGTPIGNQDWSDGISPLIGLDRGRIGRPSRKRDLV